MGIEERIAFREALLSHRTKEEWKDYRPQHMNFYHSLFSFEGAEVAGRDLIAEYSSRFPTNRDYSDRAHLNRMLEECAIPQFSFSDPETLRGFLLSAKTPAEWKKYAPSFHSFDSMTFQFAGINLKGQMLSHNVFVELENKKNGTNYAFIDYHRIPDLTKELWRDHSTKFVAKLFELAGLDVKSRDIREERLSKEKLREILLSKKSIDEWAKWEGNSPDFDKMRFDMDGVRIFSGSLLRRRYGETQNGRYSAKEIFDDAGISVASDPALLRSKKEDYFERIYAFFDNPTTIRNLMLQVQSENEWAQFQEFGPLRQKRVTSDGRGLTLHTLSMLYNIHKHNSTTNDLEDWITLGDAQDNPSLAGIATSNKNTLSELLDFAGIEHRWRAELNDVDLKDSVLLQRLLLRAEYNGAPVNFNQISSMNAEKFRYTTFEDPETGLKVKGHALMLYYSAFDYWKAHPQYEFSYVVQKLKKGKSNIKVMEDIISRSGLG